MNKKIASKSDIKSYYNEEKLSLVANIFVVATALIGFFDKLLEIFPSQQTRNLNITQHITNLLKSPFAFILFFISLIIYVFSNQNKKIILWKENLELREQNNSEIDKNKYLAEYYNKISQQHSIHFSHILKTSEEYAKVKTIINGFDSNLSTIREQIGDIDVGFREDLEALSSLGVIGLHNTYQDYVAKNFTKGFKRFLKDSLDEHKLLISQVLSWDVPVSIHLFVRDTKYNELKNSELYHAFVDSETLYKYGSTNKESYTINQSYINYLERGSYRDLLDHFDNVRKKNLKILAITNNNMFNKNFHVFGFLEYDVSSINIINDDSKDGLSRLRQFGIAYSETLSYYCTMLERGMRDISIQKSGSISEDDFDFLKIVKNNF